MYRLETEVPVAVDKNRENLFDMLKEVYVQTVVGGNIQLFRRGRPRP
jgi:hypothetical protein